MASSNKNHIRGIRPRFTNEFSIAIQIRWTFRFTLTSILANWSLQNFVQDTTDLLSWHVQKFVAICWPAMELQQGEVLIKFQLQAKMFSETGLWPFMCFGVPFVVNLGKLLNKPSGCRWFEAIWRYTFFCECQWVFYITLILSTYLTVSWVMMEFLATSRRNWIVELNLMMIWNRYHPLRHRLKDMLNIFAILVVLRITHALKVVLLTLCSGAIALVLVKHCNDVIMSQSAVIGEFPAQRARNAENVSIWWRHHVHYRGARP